MTEKRPPKNPLRALLPVACLAMGLAMSATPIASPPPQNEMLTPVRGNETVMHHPDRVAGSPFLLKQTDVRATVTGPVAHVEVTQSWENPNTFAVDGLYIFPLPENAAVNNMSLRIGERLIQGRMHRREEARAIYEQVEELSPDGASLGRLGRADLLLSRGHYREALSVLEESIALDEEAGNTGLLGPQYVALAETLLALGQEAGAVAAAEKAAGLSEHESVLFPAALVLVEAGRDDAAEEIAVDMENTLQSHMTAYAQLVRAAVAVRDERFGPAVELLRESLKRRDTWLGRLMLGRLYVETEGYTEALGELDTCLRRSGEAGDVFFYDFPTVRYLPPLYYFLGRAQEALGSADAAASYERFLELRRDADPPDPHAADARKRLGNETAAARRPDPLSTAA